MYDKEKFVKVSGTGSFIPGKPVPPEQIENYLGEITNAPEKVMRWIQRRKSFMREMLDIDSYHYAIDPETKKFTEDHITMAVKAANAALAAAKLTPQDIDFITFGSPYADQTPAITTKIQEALGIEACAEMAIHANCTSVYKALMVAYDMIRNGRYKNALVTSSCINSSVLRADFFNQPILKTEDVFLRWFLCDGAGAVVLEASDTNSGGVFVEHVYIESIGGKRPVVMGQEGPAYWTNLLEAHEKGYHHRYQKFRENLTQLVGDTNGRSIFCNGLERMLKKHNIDLSHLKFFQINMPSKHVVEAFLSECEKFLGISRDAVYTKISNMGYAGPPAAFICLDRIFKEEKLSKNDLILSFVLEISKFMQAGFTMRCL